MPSGSRTTSGFGDPAGDWNGAWESWTLLSALAASTHRVALGNYVLAVSFRNPALLAKMAETLDEISGGRVILGLGAGWNEPEYTSYGVPFDDRFRRFEDALRIITDMLRHGSSTHDGHTIQTRSARIEPRGPRPSGLPVHGRRERPADAPPDGRAGRPLERRHAEPRRAARDARGDRRRLSRGGPGSSDAHPVDGGAGADGRGAGGRPGRGERDPRRARGDRREAPGVRRPRPRPPSGPAAPELDRGPGGVRPGHGAATRGSTSDPVLSWRR